MCKVYGYCRVSTRTQKIQRQIDNVKRAYPEARIYQEAYTGTKFYGRKELEALLRQVKSGDTIVFDSVSRMSRNAEEGFTLYKMLYNKGVTLVFLKEPHVNTDTYKQAVQRQIAAEVNSGDKDTDLMVNSIMEAINRYMMALAEKQIQLAFEQSQKEVDDMRQRTKEGLQKAYEAGKQKGRPSGIKPVYKKAIKAKEVIKSHCVDFGGGLNDTEAMTLAGVSRNTYYKYKRELKAEAAGIRL